MLVGKEVEATYLNEGVEVEVALKRSVAAREVELPHFFDNEAPAIVYPRNVFHPLHPYFLSDDVKTGRMLFVALVADIYGEHG